MFSDRIPDPVKRQVRQQCGFGCVVCGSPFYDYEHWNPEFKDLNGAHRAEGITLCCPNCHRRKGTLLSNADYENCIQHPKALSDGFVRTEWSSSGPLSLRLGNIECTDIRNIVVVDGSPVIAFVEPESSGAPLRLIARFFDRTGIEQFRIDHNECIGNPDAWDITSNAIQGRGWNWVVRKGSGEIDLDVSVLPPSRVEINRLRMQIGTVQVRANERGFQILEHTSDLGLISRIYISKGKVYANAEEHVFFGLDRTYDLNQASHTATVQNHFRIGNNATIDGEGDGIFAVGHPQEFI